MVHESSMFLAIALRICVIGMRSTSSPCCSSFISEYPGTGFGFAVTAFRSFSRILPFGPVPTTVERSIPSCVARCLTAGVASTSFTAFSCGLSACFCTAAFVDAAAFGAGASPADVLPSSICASTSPTLTSVSTFATILALPETGEGMLTTALSVSIWTRGWSSFTLSPSFTSHSFMCPSVIPSPISTNLSSFMIITTTKACLSHFQPSSR